MPESAWSRVSLHERANRLVDAEAGRTGRHRRHIADELINRMLDDAERRPLTASERAAAAIASRTGPKPGPRAEFKIMSLRRGTVELIAQRAEERGVSIREAADELVNALIDDAERRPLTKSELLSARCRALPGPRTNGPRGFVVVSGDTHGRCRARAEREGLLVTTLFGTLVNAMLDAAGAPR